MMSGGPPIQVLQSQEGGVLTKYSTMRTGKRRQSSGERKKKKKSVNKGSSCAKSGQRNRSSANLLSGNSNH